MSEKKMVTNGNNNQKTSQTSKILTRRLVNTRLKTKRTVRKTMRRSVTIEEPLHDYIIGLRGWFGIEKHIDVDYTTVLNILAKLGADLLQDMSRLTERQKELVIETIESNPHQKVEAAADDWWTQHLKVQLPEYDPVIEEPQEEEVSAKEKGKD